MKKIGITGGIGSGKSTVCRIFEGLGIPVFSADEEAKVLYDDAEVKKKVTALLGAEVYTKSGLDRALVAKKVFGDEALLKQLNAIIHPAVQQRFEEWCKEQKDVPYVLKEAAILFESGSDKGTDAVIIVTAPEELRIKRVMGRDNVSREQVLKRMQNQWKEEEKIRRSQFVVVNDEQQLLIPQVIRIHEAISRG